MDPQDSRAALGRVADGRVESAEQTNGGADEVWIRLATEGKVIERITDRIRGPYGVRAALIAHPDLPSGEVYAVFGMETGYLTTYRCSAEDARLAILDPACFNL